MAATAYALVLIGFLTEGLSGQNLGENFFSDWGLVGGRSSQPTCVDIPRNMSLCHGIGYTKMRLPNLLDHDSMAEVLQQAASWVPLLNVRCHPDTQLFLCSLFSPVCLDRPIYPCRGLCERVRQGCEGRMKTYGYPWPDMLRCDKFPLDNDMCISPLSSQSSAGGSDCQACEQVETYENILDHFCRADFVMRAKLRRLRRNKITGKKAKVLKVAPELRDEWRRNKRPNVVFDLSDQCCTDASIPPANGKATGPNAVDRFLVMGHRRNNQLVPTLILPWTKKSKAIRSAVKVFKKFNCSDPKAVFGTETPSAQQTADNGRKRRGQKHSADHKDKTNSGSKHGGKTSTSAPTTKAMTTPSADPTPAPEAAVPTPRPQRRGGGGGGQRKKVNGEEAKQERARERKQT